MTSVLGLCDSGESNGGQRTTARGATWLVTLGRGLGLLEQHFGGDAQPDELANHREAEAAATREHLRNPGRGRKKGSGLGAWGCELRENARSRRGQRNEPLGEMKGTR